MWPSHLFIGVDLMNVYTPFSFSYTHGEGERFHDLSLYYFSQKIMSRMIQRTKCAFSRTQMTGLLNSISKGSHLNLLNWAQNQGLKSECNAEELLNCKMTSFFGWGFGERQSSFPCPGQLLLIITKNSLCLFLYIFGLITV